MNKIKMTEVENYEKILNNEILCPNSAGMPFDHYLLSARIDIKKKHEMNFAFLNYGGKQQSPFEYFISTSKHLEFTSRRELIFAKFLNNMHKLLKQKLNFKKKLTFNVKYNKYDKICSTEPKLLLKNDKYHKDRFCIQYLSSNNKNYLTELFKLIDSQNEEDSNDFKKVVEKILRKCNSEEELEKNYKIWSNDKDLLIFDTNIYLTFREEYLKLSEDERMEVKSYLLNWNLSNETKNRLIEEWIIKMNNDIFCICECDGSFPKNCSEKFKRNYLIYSGNQNTIIVRKGISKCVEVIDDLYNSHLINVHGQTLYVLLSDCKGYLKDKKDNEKLTKNDLLIVSSHLSDKNDKTFELTELLDVLKNYNGNYICGVDANQEINTSEHDVYPCDIELTKTVNKMRTLVQSQFHKSEVHDCMQKDHIITNKKTEYNSDDDKLLNIEQYPIIYDFKINKNMFIPKKKFKWNNLSFKNILMKIKDALIFK